MRLFVLMAAFAVLLQSFGQSVILINFRINQEYIARVLCENKDKPELKCNGNCQLTKQLKEEEQKQQQLPPQLKLKEIIQIVWEQLDSLIENMEFRNNQFFIPFSGSLLIGFQSHVFQPPDLD
ncbi:MAG: hypothetical protein KG029_02800 [Bacteroidetes bacterium]|nr:hypothetical protein [Bacteroidota bacterium]